MAAFLMRAVYAMLVMTPDGYNKYQRIFIIANSDRPRRRLLLDLVSDYRIRPLDVQYLCGLHTYRPQDLAKLTRLQVENPETLDPYIWASYIIVIETGSDIHAYAGSAQSTKSTNTGDTFIGLKQRIIYGHEPAFKRAHIDGGLRVHRLGRREGRRIRYFCLSRPPPIVYLPDQYLYHVTSNLNLFLENYHIVKLGCLSNEVFRRFKDPNQTIRSGLVQGRTKKLFEYLDSEYYRKSFPWDGANGALPLAQSEYRTIPNFLPLSSGSRQLHQVILEFCSETPTQHLSERDLLNIGDRLSILSGKGPVCVDHYRSVIRSTYLQLRMATQNEWPPKIKVREVTESSL
jgi:hypothetical protein